MMGSASDLSQITMFIDHFNASTSFDNLSAVGLMWILALNKVVKRDD